MTAWFPRPPIDPYGPEERTVAAVDLVQEFGSGPGAHRVLNGINFSVGPGERLAVLGRNGAGKSTLIKVLAGMLQPTRGYIHRGLSLSWPLALGGGFEGEMTGLDNLRFIARIYGAPLDRTYDFVMDFSELGRHIHEPVRHYSDGMRMRLGFALSLAFEFECLLIDEVLLVGDQRFQQKCMEELFDRRQHCGMILAIHAMELVKERCTKVLVLQNGRGRVFDDVLRGCDTYATL